MQYDLVPAGIHYATGDQLCLTIVWPENTTYEEIEASLAGCDRIEILAEAGELLEAIAGYTFLASLRKQYDYVISTERVEVGQDDDSELVYINRDVTGNVMVVTLKRQDIRKQIDQLAEELTATQLALVDIYEGKAV